MKTFFDVENLHDCMNELYERELNGKIYRLIFEMNKDTRIKVKTPVGVTKTKEVGPTVTQGSVDAALVSASSLDKGVDKEFNSETNEESIEVKYKDLVPLFPWMILKEWQRIKKLLRKGIIKWKRLLTLRD